MLHESLWNENQKTAQACLECDFVSQLGKGTLDENVFKSYVAQDAFFLRSFLRAYAIAAAKSESLIHVMAYHELMGGVLDELRLHANYATDLGINLEKIEPYEETLSYTEFLKTTAWEKEINEITAAMVPCMKLYAWLGQQLQPNAKPDNPYQNWINTYASEDFQNLATHLEKLLDEVAEETDAVKQAYQKAMQCELDFFNAPIKHTVQEEPSQEQISNNEESMGEEPEESVQTENDAEQADNPPEEEPAPEQPQEERTGKES